MVSPRQLHHAQGHDQLFPTRQLQFGRLRGSPRSPLGAPSRSTKMAIRRLPRWTRSRKPGSSAFLFRQPSAGRALPAARRLRERWPQRSEFLVGAASRSDAFTKAMSTQSGWWRPMEALRSAPGWPTRRDEERCWRLGCRRERRRPADSSYARRSDPRGPKDLLLRRRPSLAAGRHSQG